MRTEISYSGQNYALPREFLRELTELQPTRGIREVCWLWVQIACLWGAGRILLKSEWVWVGIVPFSFLIAGRLGAFLQLIHEASHYMLFPDRAVNRNVAKWLLGLPIGVFYEGYASGHRRHHAHTNTIKDPLSDREKYRITNIRDPKLLLLFVKDLLGWTALSIFFDYKSTEDKGSSEEAPSKLKSLTQLCLVQTVILLLAFQGDLRAYILLWIFPAISPHMFLMRIRGIAEHGLSQQLGHEIHVPSEGTFYTRSFLTPRHHYRFLPAIWLEKYFIGSYSVHFHHEHHLFPTVPFYHLKQLHERISPQVEATNPDVYADGYVAAALRNLSFPPRKLEAAPA